MIETIIVGSLYESIAVSTALQRYPKLLIYSKISSCCSHNLPYVMEGYAQVWIDLEL